MSTATALQRSALMTNSSDHPVFKRFSRQQLIVRRRSIGFQTLVFDLSLPKTPRCKHCGRYFNTVWKEHLCHVCGLWVCQPCSSVVEREREINRIQYVRACYACLSMLNKWSDAELITQFAMSPWVVQSSKSQLSLSLSDALRTRKESRQAVLVLLRHLGMAVDPSAAVIDEITEADWVAATTQDVQTPPETSDSTEKLEDTCLLLSLVESAQHLVQQCFEVVIPELPISECRFAETNGTRTYPIYYDPEEQELGHPLIGKDEERELCIDRYSLLHRNQNGEEMQLLCDIAAKEMDATSAFVSVVRGDKQHSIAGCPGAHCSTLRRSEAFCGFALTSTLPFLVRDAALDIRFRNFDVVRGSSNLQFYLGFPVISETGAMVASLCVVDSKPRKHVTTMQYSIMKKLSQIIASMWSDALVAAQI